MSRASAGIAAGVGGVVGAIGGAFVDAALPGLYDASNPGHLHPSFVGVFLGAVVGAALGAGSCPPCVVKTVGTADAPAAPSFRPRFL